MKERCGHLFSDRPLYDVFDERNAAMKTLVEGLSRDDVLGVSEDDLTAHLVSRFSVEWPRLMTESVTVEHEEVKIDATHDPGRDVRGPRRFFVPGVRLTVTLPFTGDAELFEYEPSQLSGNPPIAGIQPHELHLVYTVRNLDPAAARGRIDSDIARIQEWLNAIEGQVNFYNAQLDRYAREHIQARRALLVETEGAVAALGLPVRRRDAAAGSYVLSNVQRKKRIVPRPTPTERFMPEPELDLATYDEILAIIAEMTDVIERSPHAFAHLDEEALRTHLLVPLNSQFEGGASGETFNYEGKTDILIRHDGKVVFVAECKIWAGPKTLTDAIAQIRGYLSWRDTKTAVIMFVRNRDFSSVVDKVTPTVETTAGWKRTAGQTGESSFRFVFGHRDDPNREIILSVILLAVLGKEELDT